MTSSSRRRDLKPDWPGDRCTYDDLIGPQCHRTETVQRPEQLEHDPENWIPVFGKDHAQTTSQNEMAIQSNPIPL